MCAVTGLSAMGGPARTRVRSSPIRRRCGGGLQVGAQVRAVDVAVGAQVGDLALHLPAFVGQQGRRRGRSGGADGGVRDGGGSAVGLLQQVLRPPLGVGEDRLSLQAGLVGQFPGVALGVRDVQVGRLLRLRQDPDGLEVGVLGRQHAPGALGRLGAQPVQLLIDGGLVIEDLDELALDVLQEAADLLLVITAPSKGGRANTAELSSLGASRDRLETTGRLGSSRRSPLCVCEGFQADAVACDPEPGQLLDGVPDHGGRPAHVGVMALPGPCLATTSERSPCSTSPSAECRYAEKP